MKRNRNTVSQRSIIVDEKPDKDDKVVFANEELSSPLRALLLEPLVINHIKRWSNR